MRFITPDWPAPDSVQTASTMRRDGYSTGHWDSFNLGQHVGDQDGRVVANRRLLRDSLQLPVEPVWLQQVHGTEVFYADSPTVDIPVADAVWTDKPDVVLSIMTADCLPVLFTSKSGDCIAAVHAGWRGLASGILQKTVTTLPVPANQLMAWMGPAIGPAHFEVGEDVLQAFISIDPAHSSAFTESPTDPGKYLADLFSLARAVLVQVGVANVYGGGVCTYSDAGDFFSYRRDGAETGRMATLIWTGS